MKIFPFIGKRFLSSMPTLMSRKTLIRRQTNHMFSFKIDKMYRINMLTLKTCNIHDFTIEALQIDKFEAF